jgi:hypothetical protein
MSNRNLNNAKKNKNDEFYTKLEDIENELKHYKEHFKNKVIYCNCDNPEWSNFWKYFSFNFSSLGLKKLIATFYSKENNAYMKCIEWKDDILHITIKPLEGNGDFRNDENIEILKEADIVVSNPPFSLFRLYMEQLIECNKKFIIVGNINAITYKNVFPLIMQNEIHLGHSRGIQEFEVPENYNGYYKDGKKYAKISAATWYTNLEHDYVPEKIELTHKYDPEYYP